MRGVQPHPGAHRRVGAVTADRPESVVIEADGGSRGNPGPAGYGALLRDAQTGQVIAEAAESIGVATNNVAEYNGLLAGLALYAEHAAGASLEVRMDSKLVIEQMAGRWKVKHRDMVPLALQARRLVPPGTVWTWVPRERNTHADRLANQAMDAAASGVRGGGRAGAGAGAGAGVNRPGDPVPTAAEPPAPGPVQRKNPMLGWSGLLGTPTNLVMLRHGYTVHTVDKRFSGPGGEDPGLTDEGREQSARAAKALQSSGGVEAIVSSPLRRTTETAEVVAEVLGLPVEVDDDFAECRFGEWDGLTLSEVQARWPSELDDWLGSMEYAPPGGESIATVRSRVERGVGRLLADHPGRTVLVVSHVNPIKLVVRLCLDAPVESINKMQLAAGSLTTVSFYDSGATSLRQFSALP